MFAPLNSDKDSKDLNQNSEKEYIFILIDNNFKVDNITIIH